jgi:hypothetical protein
MPMTATPTLMPMLSYADPQYFFKNKSEHGETPNCDDLYRLQEIAADNFLHVPGRISLSGTRAGS